MTTNVSNTTANIILRSPKAVRAERLSLRLLAAFRTRGVRHCIWKGSRSLEDGLTGADDLDVLVDQRDSSAAVEILAEYEFKRGESITGLNTPGVSHYYGYDPLVKNPIHVHLYTQLLTGESLVLTHRLPLEQMLLQDAVLVQGVQVASPASELAVFILRTMIKYGSAIELSRFGRRAGTIHATLHGLLHQVDSQAAYTALEKHLTSVTEELFDRCARALREEWPLWHRFALGWQVRQRLSGYARFNTAGRLGQYSLLAWSKLRRVVAGRRARKVIPKGIVIAFVGADATGKSTLVSSIDSWLGGVFVTRRFHLGKPPSGWLTAPLHVMLPMGRHFFPKHRHRGSTLNPTGSFGCRPSILQAIRAVALAWDRRRLVRKVHRSAAAGEIAICDRYPSNCLGAMDSPRLQSSEVVNNLKTRIVNLLARWEEQLYLQNPPPDVVVKLTVSIDVARERNARRQKNDKHTDGELTCRHQSFHLWHVHPTTATVELDTGEGLRETTSAIRRVVWRSL